MYTMHVSAPLLLQSTQLSNHVKEECCLGVQSGPSVCTTPPAVYPTL